ncbi:hypothetical protein GWL_00060 [Herbaspirillum sp. GW103]|nr:hypothetical protein GWL_00060 [Herbaspirillum sp. GW103]
MSASSGRKNDDAAHQARHPMRMLQMHIIRRGRIFVKGFMCAAMVMKE